MTRKKFEVLVKEILKKLPKEFKSRLQNVDVVVQGRTPVRVTGQMGSGQLLGLYQGVPLKDRTHYYSMAIPDKITLYQRNIELECKAHGLDIREEVRSVILHEIAHHLGISDKRLEDLDVY